jgi:hypothetical protein
MKVMITKSFKFVFAYVKDELYACHIDMSRWIKYVPNGNENSIGVTKIEEVD